jgi:hypothetical protein
MKASFLLALTLAGALTAASYAAGKPAVSIDADPVAVKIVGPLHLPRSFENAHVELSLTIDAAGVPHEIAMVGYVPDNVKNQLVSAVAQWRFTPKYEHGRAVSTRVVLPLRLVDGGVS